MLLPAAAALAAVGALTLSRPLSKLLPGLLAAAAVEASSFPLAFLLTTWLLLPVLVVLPPETFLLASPEPAPLPLPLPEEATEVRPVLLVVLLFPVLLPPLPTRPTLLARPRRSLICASACSRVMVGVSAGLVASKLGRSGSGCCSPSPLSPSLLGARAVWRAGVRCALRRRCARVGPSSGVGSERRGTFVVVTVVIVVLVAG